MTDREAIMQERETLLGAYLLTILVIAGIAYFGRGDPLMEGYLLAGVLALTATGVVGLAYEYESRKVHFHDRVQPDDEIVFHGAIHMERMDDDTIFVQVGDARFNFTATRRRGKNMLVWQTENGWERIAIQLG
jgi:hypothetical protein